MLPVRAVKTFPKLPVAAAFLVPFQSFGKVKLPLITIIFENLKIVL
jgi:hypothetical protein